MSQEDNIDTLIHIKQQVGKYLDAFMFHNNINKDIVLVNSIDVLPREEGYVITIQAAFSGPLVGMGGETSKKIARGLSKLLDCKLKLLIKE